MSIYSKPIKVIKLAYGNVKKWSDLITLWNYISFKLDLYLHMAARADGSLDWSPPAPSSAFHKPPLDAGMLPPTNRDAYAPYLILCWCPVITWNNIDNDTFIKMYLGSKLIVVAIGRINHFPSMIMIRRKIAHHFAWGIIRKPIQTLYTLWISYQPLLVFNCEVGMHLKSWAIITYALRK